MNSWIFFIRELPFTLYQTEGDFRVSKVREILRCPRNPRKFHSSGKNPNLYGMLLKPSYTIKEALEKNKKKNYGINKNSQNENFCFTFYVLWINVSPPTRLLTLVMTALSNSASACGILLSVASSTMSCERRYFSKRFRNG